MIDESNFNLIMEEVIMELQGLKEVVKIFSGRMDELNNKIVAVEGEITKLQLKAPKLDMLPIYQLVDDSLKASSNSVSRQLETGLSKNKILVLPEDNGKGFFKIYSLKFLILSTIIFFALFVCWFGCSYFYMNSRNTIFRKEWYWCLINQDKQGEEMMIKDLNKFNIPAINKARTDSIQKYLDKTERFNQINQLQNEIDSLKTTKDEKN